MGCNLPNTATKEQRAAVHRSRMIERAGRREMDRPKAWYARQLAQKGVKIYENLSAYHPDFGMTAVEHAKRKVDRAAGRERFVPKASLRAQRSGFFGRMLGK